MNGHPDVNPADADKQPLTKKELDRQAKRHEQRRKSNPKLYLDGDNRTIVFEEKPAVFVDNQMLSGLMSFSSGPITLRLLGIEVLDGKAAIHLEKEE